MKVALFAPPDFWSLTPEQKQEICNGCGPGAWKVDLVPDHPLGLHFDEACNIHDYCYAVGKTVADKEAADRIFFNNMLRVVDATTTGLFEALQGRALALAYYEAVKHFGGPAFWEGKNLAAEMREVEL